MKIRYLAFLFMLIGPLQAEPDASLLKMHLDRLNRGPVSEVSEWPKYLFSGVKKKVATKIEDRKTHDAWVQTIPKELLKDFRLGATIEHEGWFFTPVDNSNSHANEPGWILVIASRKGGEYLYFNSVW